ncbi:MAG: hypothetical protein K2I39_04865 [Muribaculaceae bacterium]|nr:hypothetical protein [Muribaculaceae bacterium]
MEFSFPKHFTTGFLSGDDLTFFYYDICQDHLQGWPQVYDWEAVVDEFKGRLDIDNCSSAHMDDEFVQNKIRFTVSNQKKSDNGSKAAAFFRHLRNAFANHSVVREGDNYDLTDGTKNATMRGLVNVKLLKEFCFKFFDYRERLTDKYDNINNPTLNNL